MSAPSSRNVFASFFVVNWSARADASDGVASLYVDGKHIATAEGLKMRDSPEQVVDSMVFHTFFGGSGPAWAAAKDEVRPLPMP